MTRKFPRGEGFPNEGFVLGAIERHFRSLGFALLDEGFTDFACIHRESGERWVIEAKGHSTDVGLDFNTCLGQLLKRMHDGESAKFGLAMPATPQYEKQIRQIGRKVREALGLHWLLINESGVVQLIGPSESISDGASLVGRRADRPV